MLTLLIVVALGYVGVFVALWVLRQWERQRPAASLRRIRFIAWGGGIWIEAPTDGETVDAFLKLDHDLAGMGR